MTPTTSTRNTFRFAIDLFQRDHALTVDGKVSAKMQSALEEAFGC